MEAEAGVEAEVEAEAESNDMEVAIPEDLAGRFIFWGRFYLQ